MFKTSNCKNLNFCIYNAMKYVKINEYNSAIISFMSDISKSECTKHIKNDKIIIQEILKKNIGNYKKFKETLLKIDNKNKCKCNNYKKY